jgi:uncharacterized membrane protein
MRSNAMALLQPALVAAAFLCSLVAGLLFSFAVVVMPGIGRLDDRDFLGAFQAIDRVIQNNQPLFIVAWVGSVLALLAAAVLGVWELAGLDRVLVIVAAAVYIAGVQLPTVTINIPLNNTVKRLEVSTMSDAVRQRARSDFEARWNRWNVVRSVIASIVSLLLLIVLLRL